MRTRRLVPLVLVPLLALAGCAPAGDTETTTITVRLWDEQVAEAYEESFAEFERLHSDIRVDVVVVPWADYWSKLRLDIASGRIDDVFWTNAGNFQEFAREGRLLDVTEALGAEAASGWSPSVVEQYTADDALWGVPQLTDPGIGVFYNADLLREAGVAVEEVERLSWDPSGESDTLRSVAERLTVDAEGRTPSHDGFDERRVEQYGYSASNDLNAITINYLGSNGAAWQDGDEFVFASPEGIEAFRYLVELITVDHVAPPAADTNPPTGGDFALEQFLQGRLALFQTGPYNLANVLEGADFEWGIAPLPTGPAGAISVTNGIIAAARADSENPEAQRRVLEWLASAEGSSPIGASGSALPAVIDAQESFFAFWEGEGVDLSPLVDVLANGTVQPPQGARYAAAEEAYRPLLNEVFLGRLPVEEGVTAAQEAANAAMRE